MRASRPAGGYTTGRMRCCVSGARLQRIVLECVQGGRQVAFARVGQQRDDQLAGIFGLFGKTGRRADRRSRRDADEQPFVARQLAAGADRVVSGYGNDPVDYAAVERFGNESAPMP